MAPRNVLLIDDDRNIQTIVEVSLEDEWLVSAASSGQEALDELLTRKPDLILMDMSMPGMDGPATLDKIRRQPGAETIPVILLTARARTSGLESELEVAGIIPKPFDPATLADEIEAILEINPPTK